MVVFVLLCALLIVGQFIGVLPFHSCFIVVADSFVRCFSCWFNVVFEDCFLVCCGMCCCVFDFFLKTNISRVLSFISCTIKHTLTIVTMGAHTDS